MQHSIPASAVQHCGSLRPSWFLWMWKNCSFAQGKRKSSRPGAVPQSREGRAHSQTHLTAQPSQPQQHRSSSAGRASGRPCHRGKSFNRNTRASDGCGCALRVCFGGWCFLKTSEKNVSAACFGESR